MPAVSPLTRLPTDQTSKPKVYNFCFKFLIEQNVAYFDIPVDDSRSKAVMKECYPRSGATSNFAAFVPIRKLVASPVYEYMIKVRLRLWQSNKQVAAKLHVTLLMG